MLGDVPLVSYRKKSKPDVHKVEFTLAALKANSVFSVK